MARIELAPDVAEDFDRILDHLATYRGENPAWRIGEIVTALDVLERNPLNRPSRNQPGRRLRSSAGKATRYEQGENPLVYPPNGSKGASRLANPPVTPFDKILRQKCGDLSDKGLIGRPVTNGMRELVIGRRSAGYLALYRYVPEIDIVFVLAIRRQLEAGYAEIVGGIG